MENLTFCIKQLQFKGDYFSDQTPYSVSSRFALATPPLLSVHFEFQTTTLNKIKIQTKSQE